MVETEHKTGLKVLKTRYPEKAEAEGARSKLVAKAESLKPEKSGAKTQRDEDATEEPDCD